jgi:hypothetical protein
MVVSVVDTSWINHLLVAATVPVLHRDFASTKYNILYICSLYMIYLSSQLLLPTSQFIFAPLLNSFLHLETHSSSMP